MLLLSPSPELPGRQYPVTVIFGVGLLGASLGGFLERIGFTPQRLALDWADRQRQRVQVEQLRQRLASLGANPATRRMAIVWAAGRAGFDACPAQTGLELASFLTVLELSRSLAERDAGVAVEFHMLSSVGGLFEGQRHIDRFSTPRPLRPYGVLKLQQEEALLAVGDSLRKRVYRLTSVFGHAVGGARRGLVSTLLENTATRQVTSLVGRLSTLRDFVWSADVARHISRRLLGAGYDGPVIETLGSGKPSSIHEVIKVVESATRQRAYIRCAALRGNDLDITVSPTALAPGWSATDLKTAVVSLAHRLA